MIQVGEKIRFRPHAWLNVGEDSLWGSDIPDMVTGTVVMVNEEHGIYRVAYDCHGLTQYETFKLEAVCDSHTKVPEERGGWHKESAQRRPKHIGPYKRKE